MILSLVFLLCFTFACQNGEEVAEEPAVDITADVEAIKAEINQLSYAHDSGDLDSFLATQTEDVILMPPGEESLYSKAAVRERFTPMFEFFNLKIAPSIDEVEVSGDLAFVRYSYSLQVIPKTEGEMMELNGKVIFILTRQSDSSWKITHYISNFNSPSPPQEE
jgi:ketosteroid isomerase-like protein